MLFQQPYKLKNCYNKMINKLLAFLSIIIFLGQESWAFDPLSSELNLPINNYDFYSDKENMIEKSCHNFVDKEDLTVFLAINIGLCNNPATKVSWLAVKKQAAVYGIAKSNYLPSATINSEKTYSKTTTQHEGESKTNNVSNVMSLNWLLYDFGARGARLERDYFLLIQAAQAHNRYLQQIIYDIIIAYSNLLAAQETLNAAIISEESNELAFNVVSKKFAVGLAPKADVLQIESNYSQSTLSRQKAENSAAIYLASFLQLLALPQNTEVKLLSPSFAKASEFLDQDIDGLIQKALQDRPDLKAMIAKQKSQKSDLIATKRDRFVQINITTSQGYSDLRNDNNRRASSAGISLTYNFFTGFKQSYLVNQSYYEHQSTTEERRRLENEIAFDVSSSMQNLKTATATEITAQKLLNSATASREVALGMYKVGKGSIVDVITAETIFASAMKELIVAKYNKFTSEASVLLAIGDLGGVLSD